MASAESTIASASSEPQELLAAARRGEQRAFAAVAEPYRRRLQTHCYRMLGSIQDAEDTVQETFLRAWKRIATFDGRGTLRSWLYQIATNACLDLLKKRPCRRLPQRNLAPAEAGAPLMPAVTEPIWLEPYADELIADPETSSEVRFSAAQSVSLAFVAVLQSLPPRQRAVLLLFDVLDWKASEIADLLDSTISAVNSALHRARSTVSSPYHARGRDELGRTGPRSADAEVGPLAGYNGVSRSRLEQYVKAWEEADAAGLAALLKEDATFSMPPVPNWYLGRSSITEALVNGIFAGEARRRWLLRPAGANRQPTFAVYQRQESGSYRLFGIQVLRPADGLIADIVTFLDPKLFRFFNLAEVMSDARG